MQSLSVRWDEMCGDMLVASAEQPPSTVRRSRALGKNHSTPLANQRVAIHLHFAHASERGGKQVIRIRVCDTHTLQEQAGSNECKQRYIPFPNTPTRTRICCSCSVLHANAYWYCASAVALHIDAFQRPAGCLYGLGKTNVLGNVDGV